MTWHFNYTIPSFIFLIFFLVFYFLKPIHLTKSNHCFLTIIISEVLGFFITFISSYFDNNSSNYCRALLYFLNGSYYVLFVLRYFLFSLYFGFLFKVKFKKDIPSIITAIVTFSVIVLIILTPLCNIIYRLSPTGKYEQTDFFQIIYISNAVTLLLDIYYIIKYRKKLNSKELVSSIFVIITLIACCLIDNLYVTYLITDMFFLFVILTLFLAFENPDIYTDKKTGLFNVQAFSYVINEYLFSKTKYSVIAFIIQNYPEKKQIYGTKLMDLALKEIGNFIQSLFRHKKYFYLQNGKFVIIDKSAEDFAVISKEVLARSLKPWVINNCELHLNIITIDMENDVRFNSIEDITVGFGMAYEEAKKKADHHVTINKDSLNNIYRKTKIAKSLNKALLEDNLQVYLQPVYNIATHSITGAEALVRIQDEELGLIPPVEFISLAEKNGSIEQLGEQVLNKVCIYLNKSNINKKGIEWINVNLSPVQCQNINLPRKIDNITNINTIDHNFIHLEITEEAIIDTSILKDQMSILITNGYSFALDDFGSGFSNIARVKTLPFNNIKLDMSIVWDYFNAPDEMLPNIIKTFRSKGLTVTAEGVETKEMAEALEKMGCNFLQGYYFSKPVPTSEFEEVIKRINK